MLFCEACGMDIALNPFKGGAKRQDAPVLLRGLRSTGKKDIKVSWRYIIEW